MTLLKCTDIVSGITHDLTSPLNAIIGFVDLALEDLTKISNVSKETIKDLNMVRDIGKDMTDLINNMLTSARIQSGQQPLSIERISREELIEQIKLIERTFYAEAVSRRISFSITHSRLPKYVYWDIKSLRYFVINNLISNALKFVGNDGIVQVHIESDVNDIVTMSIADNGPGVPKMDRENIFNKFSQASNNIRSFSGSGYGLFNAANMVKAHDGSIDIQDGLDGKGVSFVVRILAQPFPNIVIKSLMGYS